MVITKRLKVLGAVAVAIGVYILVSGADSGANTSATVAVADTASAQKGSASAALKISVAPMNASHESGGLLARLGHRVADSKAVSALFHPQSWYVAPPPPPPPPPAPVIAPPPPSAPPLPFTIMGSYARPGEAKVYFLTRGDRVFDVHVGDTIDNTYSVEAETNGQLTLTYKPLNIQQTLAVGGS